MSDLVGRRMKRYLSKKKTAVTIPLEICTVNFQNDENIALLMRTSACFGVDRIHVIGSLPEYSFLRARSGSTNSFVEAITYRSPTEFLSAARDSKANIISAELSDQSTSLYDHKFDFSTRTILVIWNETTGVPQEIIFNSKCLFIPMIGVGYCLNASHTGTAFISEYVRQLTTNME